MSKRWRGHIASSVECYTKQNSVSEQLAYRELNKQVEEAWKDINQEFLRPTAIPMHLLTRVLNFALTREFMYEGREDIFTNLGCECLARLTISDKIPKCPLTRLLNSSSDY